MALGPSQRNFAQDRREELRLSIIIRNSPRQVPLAMQNRNTCSSTSSRPAMASGVGSTIGIIPPSADPALRTGGSLSFRMRGQSAVI